MKLFSPQLPASKICQSVKTNPELSSFIFRLPQKRICFQSQQLHQQPPKCQASIHTGIIAPPLKKPRRQEAAQTRPGRSSRLP